MKINIKIVPLLLLAATACGDNKLEPDARTRDSGSGSGGFPTAPALGTQIDRMGRPAINTLLNHGFDPTAAAGSAKNDYNADSNFGSAWQAKWAPTFAKTIGVLDALDTGICGNLKCETGEKGTLGIDLNSAVCVTDCGSGTTVGTGNACGNTVLYNFGTPAMGTSTPNAGSYVAMGALLADDELFLNTDKPICSLYLAVEFYASQPGMEGAESVCGGRNLDYDVVDFSWSMIAAGAGGFNLAANFDPRIKDGVSKHTDYLPDFPYLGPPHS
jgi:hypothetical protein